MTAFTLVNAENLRAGQTLHVAFVNHKSALRVERVDALRQYVWVRAFDMPLMKFNRGEKVAVATRKPRSDKLAV
jgi:hypothetical protein